MPVTQFEELLAQLSDMYGGGDVHGHLHGEHLGARVCSRIAARRNVGDLDIVRGEEVREAVYDALVVQAHDVDSVGHAVLLDLAFSRLADREGQVPVVEFFQAFLETIQRMPVAGDQHQHREFRAKRRHAAFFDIAAAI